MGKELMREWERVMVVSFHTSDIAYTTEAARLKKSIDQWDRLPYTIETIPPGYWKDVCRQKPSIIRSFCRQFPDRPLLFVDADARFTRDPREELPNTWTEAASIPPVSVHMFGSQICSGTIVISSGQAASGIMDDWAQKDRKDCHRYSQPQQVLTSVKGINTELAPQWCWIFDLSKVRYRRPPSPPIVTHYQASREYRGDRNRNAELVASRQEALRDLEGEA